MPELYRNPRAARDLALPRTNEAGYTAAMIARLAILLCCLVALRAAAAPDPTAEAAGEAAFDRIPLVPESALAPEPGDDDPAVACYQAARSGATDAYPCDLAVRMAQDARDARALAAALTNRAQVLASGGRLEPAQEDLMAAVDALRNTPGAAGDLAIIHGNRGNLLLRLGQPAQALAAHTRAVELAPRDPAGYYNRAFSYRALGDPQQAAREVAVARSLQEGTGSRSTGQEQPRQQPGQQSPRADVSPPPAPAPDVRPDR